MSKDDRLTFEQLLDESRRFGRDDFVINLGGLVEDVSDMLSSELAQGALIQAREFIDHHGQEPLQNGMSRLQVLTFGDSGNAPELTDGKVAAVDGTPVLPLQKYSAGQALCVGIGSRSYTRLLDDVLHGYTSKAIMEDLQRARNEDIKSFLRRVQDGIYSISQTAYMRYFEVQHAMEVPEPLIFCDGTLVYEWLSNQYRGRELYKDFLRRKQAIGIIKSTKDSVFMSWFGRALVRGEVFIFETLYDHIADMARERNTRSGSSEAPQWESDVEFVALAKKVYRGVFKPAEKYFGFECHADHLDPMLRIMASDCQMNLPGHEIPFLLNEVDREIRRFFKAEMVQMRIGEQLSVDSENLFFEETGEREFR